MFNNIGNKIKGLASIITWIGIIISAVLGIALMYLSHEFAFMGLCVFLVGALMSWICSSLFYGFGELIERTCRIGDYLYSHQAGAPSPNVGNYQLLELLKNGVISQEEYEELMKQ